MEGLVSLLFLRTFFTKRELLHHGRVDRATRLRCNREINIRPRKNLEHTPLRVDCNHRVSIRRGISCSLATGTMTPVLIPRGNFVPSSNLPSPHLYSREIPRPCVPLRHHTLNIDIARSTMMRAPHLQQDKASADRWIEFHSTLALISLDEESRMRSHQLAANSSHCLLCSDL
jgi:hypothetical protein